MKASKKKEGSVQIIMLCTAGLLTLFIYQCIGLTQLQTEYDTTRLNECVQEAVMSADYIDQNASSAYGYVLLDCSDASRYHCRHDTCRYGVAAEETAYDYAYKKAEERFKDALAASLNLTDDLAPTERTPCGIKSLQIKDFRTYSVIDRTGAGILQEGKTYELTGEGGIWHDTIQGVEAPDGEAVTMTGIYVQVDFTIRSFVKTIIIPVRIFVGIR